MSGRDFSRGAVAVGCAGAAGRVAVAVAAGRIGAAARVAVAVATGRIGAAARVAVAVATGRVSAAAMPVIAALVLVGACSSSPPTRFYTLSDTAPEATPPAGVGWVRIVGVTIPGELDRPELVRRIGPNQLSISGLDRWAAPLDQTIRRALSDDIARRVPTPAPGQQYPVSVDIHEFYGDGGCNVTLRAAWTLKQSRPENAQPVNEEIQVPSSGACTATLPATMSIALGELSDRIIAGVARVPAPAPESAPSPGSAPAH
jgi:uncharacterized lipoprotein YmbA